MKLILFIGAVLITIQVILTLTWTGAFADEEAPTDVEPAGIVIPPPIFQGPTIVGTWEIAFGGNMLGSGALGGSDVCTLVFEQAFTDISWTSADCDGSGSGTINVDGIFSTSGDLDGLPILDLDGALSLSENYLLGSYFSIVGSVEAGPLGNMYGIRVQPRWDVNEDGSVSLLDFLMVLSHFGEVTP